MYNPHDPKSLPKINKEQERDLNELESWQWFVGHQLQMESPGYPHFCPANYKFLGLPNVFEHRPSMQKVTERMLSWTQAKLSGHKIRHREHNSYIWEEKDL